MWLYRSKSLSLCVSVLYVQPDFIVSFVLIVSFQTRLNTLSWKFISDTLNSPQNSSVCVPVLHPAGLTFQTHTDSLINVCELVVLSARSLSRTEDIFKPFTQGRSLAGLWHHLINVTHTHTYIYTRLQITYYYSSDSHTLWTWQCKHTWF